MKLLLSILAIAAFGLTPALAEDTGGTPVPNAPRATIPAEDGGGSGPLKAARAQCRDEVRSQNIKGPARQQSIEDCLLKARPDKAVQIKCQAEVRGNGGGGDKEARRAQIKDCVAKSRG